MSTELSSLIRGEASIADIAGYLDGLGAAARAAEANALARAEQALLFDKAADAPPIAVAHFVPPAVPDLTPVHHPGRNTIMTLPYFQRFEKRFARAADGSGRLFGYNASNAWFVTPGYFVAYETAARPEWAERGGVVVDSHQVPDADVPAGWPRVVDNGKGLQRLVYHLTRDFMRQVSRHVSIGRASREDERGDRLLDYWFTLCRQDRSSPE